MRRWSCNVIIFNKLCREQAQPANLLVLILARCHTRFLLHAAITNAVENVYDNRTVRPFLAET